jgi:hypothetical protein
MEKVQAQHDPIEGGAATYGSSSDHDIVTSMAQGAATLATDRDGDTASNVICEALGLALSAIRLDVAWHAGTISAEAAMEGLNREIVSTISSCTRSVALCQSGMRKSPRPLRVT